MWLSGVGELWCLAHPGALQVYGESGERIDAISGASGGALFGAVAAAHVDPKTHQLRPDGIAYMRRIVGGVRTFEDLVEREDGGTRLAVHRLLNPGGNDSNYRSMMREGTAVPFSVQVARSRDGRHFENDVILRAEQCGDMEHILTMAAASATNRPMFGFSPVEIDGMSCRDDSSIAYKSTATLVRDLRTRVGNVLSVSLSFGDSHPLIRRLLNRLLPRYSDPGDVVINPKEGRQALNGAASLTNWKKGWAVPFLGRKYARTEADLESGSRIAIPTGDFVEAGRKAARKKMFDIQLMLQRGKRDLPTY